MYGDLYPISHTEVGHFGDETFVTEGELNPPENTAIEKSRQTELYYQKVNLIISVISLVIFIYISFFMNNKKRV